MNEYLEKKMYVYRKSFRFYSNTSVLMLILKLLFGASGMSAYYYLPLAVLSLGGGIIEIFEKTIKHNERITEYKISYKFYQQMLNLYKSSKIEEKDIYAREKDFMEHIQFFAREKYIKEVALNGYNYII